MTRKLLAVSTVMMVIALTYLLNAGESDNQRLPEILTNCEQGIVTISYGDIDTCWPGEQIIVPVYVSNDSTLDLLKLYVGLTSDLHYVGYDVSGTPWNGGTVTEDTVGHIEITFSDGSLPISATERWLFDLILAVDSTAGYDLVDTVGYEQSPTVSYPSSQDYCYVITGLTEGIVTIPDDSVLLSIESTNAYSYQAAATDDPYKDDFPVVLSIRLYTNFPCGAYNLWFRIPDSLEYVGFDSLGGGAHIANGTPDYYYRIYGQPANKPGNDTTLYLGDIKCKVGDFRSAYEGDCSFQDTLILGFWENIDGIRSYVYSWDAADSIGYFGINMDNGKIFQPPYEVTVEVNDAEVDIDDTVDVPLSITPTFYSQYYQMFIQYDTTYLSYTGFTDAGGTIPAASVHIHDTVGVWTTIEFESSNPNPDGKYAVPLVEQTLLTMHFLAKDAFDFDDTTEIKINNVPYRTSRVFDWFSSDTLKIEIDDDDDSDCWTALDGKITLPRYFCIEPGAATCYLSGKVAKIPLNVTYVNETFGDTALLAYDFLRAADSLTEAGIRIDTFYAGPSIYAKGYTDFIVFDGDISEPGIIAYIWVSDPLSVDGKTFEIMEYGWIQYNSGANKANMTPGDPLTINCSKAHPKIDVILPLAYSLDQNYPNPFNASTEISFCLAEPGYTVLEIYDILGRKITTLLSGDMASGNHLIRWDAKNTAGRSVAGGVYFYVLRSNKFEDSKKMLYLK